MRALLHQVEADIRRSARLDAESRSDARRESRLLVAAVMDVAPGEVARRMDTSVDAETIQRVERAARRRVGGAPLAYAVGSAAFRELTLAVDERVLIPRPETEIVVGVALARASPRPGGVAVDVGTGSGAIALSLALEGAFARVIGTDVSVDALAVAAANVDRYPALRPRIEWRGGSDLEPVRDVRARVIVSNPPYIAYEEATGLPSAVRDWEPVVALFADRHGMARYESLLATAPLVLEPEGWLVLETDARRAEITRELAVRHGYREVALYDDLSGRPRVLVAQAP